MPGTDKFPADKMTDNPWPTPFVDRVLFLLDAGNPVEQNLLVDWIERSRDTACETICDKIALPIANARPGLDDLAQLERKLEVAGDALVVPVRVVWLPANVAGKSGPRVRDLILGDPRHPMPLVARMILRRNPERALCIAGEAATIDDLRHRHSAQEEVDPATATDPFTKFVLRQASLTLDVTERRHQGNRYKVPRFVADGLRSSRRFNRAMDKLAAELGKPSAELQREAQDYLKEMVAVPSTFFIDWMGKISKSIAGLGYDKEIVCDPENLRKTRELIRENPAALLWSHKSHVDGMALMSVLYENDFPAPHTLGGVNMAFAGAGYLGRRAGAIYIRRSFKDNPVYKLVFRHYLGYLMEKRFPFSWAFEGTRSRIGKLMPPRFGLLKYVVEAANATHAENLHFIPVSISYDLIGEVADYANEQFGEKKQPESLKWFLGYLKKLRAPKGRIYLDFGEPVVLSGKVKPVDQTDLAKIAFEVAVQVNQLTPVTLPSVACMALLGTAPRALTFTELTSEIRSITAWLHKRKIRMSGDFYQRNLDQLRALAETIIDRGLITRYAEGPETVFGIAEEQYPVAGYYRNTIAHYFVDKAILELSLLKASAADAQTRDELFWKETERLRDHFKFEFFYPPKSEFRQNLKNELARYDVEWEQVLCHEPQSIVSRLGEMKPLVAHSVLLPYVEAYWLVADVIERLDPDEGLDEKECVERSLKYGQQAFLQRRISSKASVGKLLFQNGFKLFENMGLTVSSHPEIAAQRTAIAEEFADMAARLMQIRTIAQEANKPPRVAAVAMHANSESEASSEVESKSGSAAESEAKMESEVKLATKSATVSESEAGG